MRINSEHVALGLHNKVLKLMEQEKKGRVLDAPAGVGNLSCYLKERGFEVWAADIDETVFKASEVRFQMVDLNKKLPYPESFFNYVICIEGIEHLENSYHLLREFGRVLKQRGKLIITTPNVLSIFSRLRYLLIGYCDFFGGYYSRETDLYTSHINPVGFPELYSALKKGEFELENIATNRNVVFTRKFPLKLLLWILIPLVKMVTRIKVKDNFMCRRLLSSELLAGEILILECVRR